MDKIASRTAGADSPQKLKKFLMKMYSDVSGNRANALLTHGQVKLNGTITSQFDAPVAAGDTVEVNFSRPFPMFRHPRLKLVYEDDDILVVNKGYGLLSVTRGTDKKEDTAYDILKKYLKDVDPANKIFVIHRLDSATSGLMMYAKNPEAKEAMQHNWNNMVLDRKYVAVVEGSVEPDQGVIRSYLGETREHEMYSSQNPEDGKLAVTRFTVLNRRGGYSLVEFSLDTGRKNQIRVHAARELGHPIVGDRRYGAKSSPIQRMALHARTLHFVHPVTGKEMNFSLPIPSKFRQLV